MPDRALQKRIADMVSAVEADRAHFGVLSTGEKCAVALVLDDIELLRWSKQFNYTMLEAVERAGEGWTAAALAVQKERR